jgi:hypothetical protein
MANRVMRVRGVAVKAGEPLQTRYIPQWDRGGEWSHYKRQAGPLFGFPTEAEAVEFMRGHFKTAEKFERVYRGVVDGTYEASQR